MTARLASSSARRDRGSVFVESMVAAAIVAAGLGATFQVIADGARRGRDVEAHRAALLVAQSELSAVGSEFPLHAGVSTGAVGDYDWRLDVSPYDDGVDSGAIGGLWSVTVSVAERAGRTDLVTLRTLRLGPKSG
jgi:hypothetical protein